MGIICALFWLVYCVIFCLADDFEQENVKPPPAVEGENAHLTDPYCFRFTWVGSRYNTESQIKNATCDDILKGGKNIPCRRPLVATDNSTQLPDTDWIWKNYKRKPSEIACRMTGGDVCVKYTYIYNQAVENITYMCAKVQIDGEGPTRSGCYSHYRNGRAIEVCACESSIGATPCNKGSELHLSSGVTTIVMFLLSGLLSRGIIVR